LKHNKPIQRTQRIEIYFFAEENKPEERSMLEKNQTIEINAEDALEVLAEIEFILISLHKIGSYYCDKPVNDYQKATTDFIDNENVTQRLAKVRKIITTKFDSTLGEDDMDDIERHMEGIQFWKP
jgi:hypothetical protein